MHFAGGFISALLFFFAIPRVHSVNDTRAARSKRGIPFTGVTIDGRHRYVTGHNVPVTIDLDQSLRIGESIRISGTLNSKFSKLNIFLAQNHGHDNEYAPFHMSIRTDGHAVLNTMQAGAWETEQHFTHFLDGGKKFVIYIRCHTSQFEIYHDFVKVYEMHNMFSLDVIKQISVDGDATLDRVEWGGGEYELPFTRIFGPMKEGRAVVTGESFNDFEITFFDSHLEKPFYLKGNFENSKMIANSMKYNIWGKEEHGTVKFPFQLGELFEITILNNNDGLTVYHNGNKVMNFAHRVDKPQQAYTGILVTPIYQLFNVIWN